MTCEPELAEAVRRLADPGNPDSSDHRREWAVAIERISGPAALTGTAAFLELDRRAP